MTDKKINAIVQVITSLTVFTLFCYAFYLIAGTYVDSAWDIVKTTAKSAILPVTIYFLNFCILVPRLFFHDRKVWFFLLEAILVILAIFLPIAFNGGAEIEENDSVYTNLLVGLILLRLLLYTCMIALAIGMRYIVRWYEVRKALEEERRRNAEAELNWLKNQLNPHFLFNTLNNISSLVRIDADKAQDSISQLSELLRYALYESNKGKVWIVDEIGFMKNYISLMGLRCSNKIQINVRFDSFSDNFMIAPLLFISLIENAFKHGTSSHKESFISVDMGLDKEDLVFSCENTIIEKSSTDYSGSGVGLDNMKRRLQLLYPDSHTYEQFVENGKYVVVVRIKKIAEKI